MRGAGSAASVPEDKDGPLLCKGVKENRDNGSDGVVWQMRDKSGEIAKIRSYGPVRLLERFPFSILMSGSHEYSYSEFGSTAAFSLSCAAILQRQSGILPRHQRPAAGMNHLPGSAANGTFPAPTSMPAEMRRRRCHQQSGYG